MGSLKPDKLPGPDKIHNRVLLKCKDQLMKSMKDLFISSFESGVLLSVLKEAEVIPIFKKRKNDPVNYGHVSLTSSAPISYLKIIRDDITTNLERNNLLGAAQHGFRAGRSCYTQFIEVKNDWAEAAEAESTVDVIYLYYRKALTVSRTRDYWSYYTLMALKAKY